MIRIIITETTKKDNLLSNHAAIKFPCKICEIARVRPHAGHSQLVKIPEVGQFPLKTSGRIKFLKMQSEGKFSA